MLPAPAQRFANAIAEVESGTALRERLAIAQATNDVRSREQDVRIARASDCAVSAELDLLRIGYPTSSASSWNDFRTNWNVASASRFRCSPDGGSRRMKSWRAPRSRSSRRGCS